MSDSSRSSITAPDADSQSSRAPPFSPNPDPTTTEAQLSPPSIATESPKRERSISTVSSTTSSAASVSFTLASMSPSVAPFYPFAAVARPAPSNERELGMPILAEKHDMRENGESFVSDPTSNCDDGLPEQDRSTMQIPVQSSKTDTPANADVEHKSFQESHNHSVSGKLPPSTLPSQDSVRSVSPIGSQSGLLGPKTPNVYINGLPPHYPEDQLFELAVPFGRIRSVRSFTRHVGEKESGYGFVLFEDVDSAEKCIHALRRFRNLHPTFSKQVHKIPGTPYAHPDITSDKAASIGPDEEEEEETEESITFKRKMEKLQDPTSTNLYMEGLPLTIDEPSLSALVSPHRIKSSRFFQTRLSNPPRIIAFVRLETRKGAEEVIERLHGRMVRGWNDSGSRISVRFADTSEQRELRRTEHTSKEGEQSPARLTIAQAALLSMHGRKNISSHIGLFPSASLPTMDIPSSRGTIRTSNSTMGSMYDLPGHAHETAISLPSLRKGDHGNHRSLTGLSSHGSYARLPPLSIPVTRSQDMSGMLDSVHLDANPYEHLGNDFQVNLIRPAQQLNLRSSHVLNDLNLNMPLPQQSGAAHASSGYTPTEEYLLQSHAMNRRRPSRLEMAQARVESHGQRTDPQRADLNVGMRGYRSQAATMSVPQDEIQSHNSFPGSRVMRSLPPVRENQGQATAHHQGPPPVMGAKSRRGAHTSPHLLHQQSSGRPSRAGSQGDSQAHVRSTTLPPHSTSSHTTSGNSHSGRHFQNNSMSVPRTKNISPDILRSPNNLRTSDRTLSPSISTKDFSSNQKTGNSIFEHGLKNRHANSTLLSAYPDADTYDDSQPSPSLVSPALTYTSRGSGPTLSPATPFMTSFPST